MYLTGFEVSDRIFLSQLVGVMREGVSKVGCALAPSCPWPDAPPPPLFAGLWGLGSQQGGSRNTPEQRVHCLPQVMPHSLQELCLAWCYMLSSVCWGCCLAGFHCCSSLCLPWSVVAVRMVCCVGGWRGWLGNPVHASARCRQESGGHGSRHVLSPRAAACVPALPCGNYWLGHFLPHSLAGLRLPGACFCDTVKQPRVLKPLALLLRLD